MTRIILRTFDRTVLAASTVAGLAVTLGVGWAGRRAARRCQDPSSTGAPRI